MSKSMLSFILSLVIVAVAGLLQISDINIFGVKPDILLAAVLAIASINKNWFERVCLILVAALMIQFYPGLSLATLLFIAAGLIGVIIIDFLPFEHFLGFLISVAIGTLLINAPHFIWNAVLTELLYNLIFGGILFLIVARYHPNSHK